MYKSVHVCIVMYYIVQTFEAVWNTSLIRTKKKEKKKKDESTQIFETVSIKTRAETPEAV